MNQIKLENEIIRIIPYNLHFLKPARTSRSILKQRKVYFIEAWNEKHPQVKGWGEIAPLDGLSPEGKEFHGEIEKLSNLVLPVSAIKPFMEYPSVRFGLEAARLDLHEGGKRTWFPGLFARGKSSISINGLIWMGDKATMLEQIRQKLSDGYPCLKLKIGGIDFRDEVELLHYIRKEFSPSVLELRLDANGSFQPDEAVEKLKILREFAIHSIEQPIPAGHPHQMAKLCELNIIPIALDEELIGIKSQEAKINLLKTIKPQHLIFKPSLIGGLAETEEYITLCMKMDIGWWITSALESNVGLNILAQFCGHLDVEQLQGLGTGKLFQNNIQSPLRERKGKVFIDPSGQWSNLDALS